MVVKVQARLAFLARSWRRPETLKRKGPKGQTTATRELCLFRLCQLPAKYQRDFIVDSDRLLTTNDNPFLNRTCKCNDLYWSVDLSLLNYEWKLLRTVKFH